MAKSVLVALSGGVDSSVAAALLIEQGYQVVGATIKMWPNSPAPADAHRVAASLGIPFYLFDYQQEFRQEVIDEFVREYKLGRTPNPCILCNRGIKFGRLLNQAGILGIDYVATGHYARIQRQGDRARLFRGRDQRRDQSYFLYTLTEDKLKRILFPLGGELKSDVRKLAQKFRLPVYDKAESQEICFLAGRNYKEFFNSLGISPAGDIVDGAGNIIGRHAGIHGYTIGQRRGLGVAGGVPLYVVDIDVKTNTVTVGRREELDSTGLWAVDFNWLAGSGPPAANFRAEVAIRSTGQAQPATLSIGPAGKVHVEFDRPQRAIAPGQAAVAYAGEQVLGGGIIDSRSSPESEGCL